MVGQWEMDPDGANYVSDVTESEIPKRNWLFLGCFFFFHFPNVLPRMLPTGPGTTAASAGSYTAPSAPASA